MKYPEDATPKSMNISTVQKSLRSLENRAPGLPNRAPKPSKTLFLQDLQLKTPPRGRPALAVLAFGLNLAPSWRPKRLQNRGRNQKKTMLKNDTFLASIFKGFGPRFGRVFGRFLGPKIHAESDLKKSVRQAESTVKTNTKSMSALLQQSIFRPKIDEKSHVFWDLDF